MSDKLREECLAYFLGKSIYKRLLEKFKDKYISLGHMGGSVELTGLSLEEKEQLGGLLSKNYRENKTVTISAKLMQKTLDASKFSGLLLEELLEYGFGKPLLGKNENERREREERAIFFEQEIQKYKEDCRKRNVSTLERDHLSAVTWIEGVLDNKTEGYRILMQKYEEDKDNLRIILKNVLTAVDCLPVVYEHPERLPIFAAKVTGNPHSFDEGTLGGRLLTLHIIERFHLKKQVRMAEPEWKSSVLFKAGILKDDISNFTLAYGIHARSKEGIHAGIEGFLQREEPVQLTLMTLRRLETVWPQNPHSSDTAIYVVENPAVFSALVEENKEICVVCCNGQPRLATFVLLDMLCHYGILRYAGDFDPEGLVIAQNLKKRYKDKLTFWGYERVNYDKHQSDLILTLERKKKLYKIEEEGLLEIKDAILECGYAAYQEKMLEIYLSYVRI